MGQEEAGLGVLAAGQEHFWVKFCQVINRQDLLTDERFKDNPSRTQNHDQLEAILNEITQKFS